MLAPPPAAAAVLAVFEQSEDPATKSFFSEIISSISDVKFSRDGRYLYSRDYLTLKVRACRATASAVVGGAGGG